MIMKQFFSHGCTGIQPPSTHLPLVIRCFKEERIYYCNGVRLDFLVCPVWNNVVNMREECTSAVENYLPAAFLQVEGEELFALHVNRVS